MPALHRGFDYDKNLIISCTEIHAGYFSSQFQPYFIALNTNNLDTNIPE